MKLLSHGIKRPCLLLFQAIEIVIPVTPTDSPFNYRFPSELLERHTAENRRLKVWRQTTNEVVLVAPAEELINSRGLTHRRPIGGPGFALMRDGDFSTPWPKVFEIHIDLLEAHAISNQNVVCFSCLTTHDGCSRGMIGKN